MKHLLFLLPLCILFPVANAEQGPSIMFEQKPNPAFQHDSGESPTEERARHCKELSRKMEQLKGKPQRRFAVAERYKAECQSRSH